MFSLAWSTIRARRGGFIAAFIALFFGAAVITASGVLLESGLRSGVTPERYAAAAVVVGGKQGLDGLNSFAERAPLPADVTDRIARVPGVRQAVPDRSVEVTVLSPNATQGYAHGWSSAQLAPFTLTAGRQPAAPGEVVVDASFGLSAGDTTRVAVGGVPADYRVVGLVSGPLAGRQSAVFVTDEAAARLSDRLAAVGVLAEPGVHPGELADRITAELADVPLATYVGRDIGDVEFLDIGQARGFLIAISASLMGTIAMVVLFVVSSTLGLSIQQRRRELAVLRAIAATPKQIHRMIGAEVLLVSATGALLGSVPGFFAAGALRDAFAAVGVLPPDFQLAFSPLPAVAALLLCVLGGWAAGYFAARRLAKANPVDALGEAAVEPAELGARRRAFGIGLLVFGVVVGTVVPLIGPGMAAVGGAAGSVLLLMIGTALLGPRLMQIAVTFVAPVLNRGRISGYLAVANTRANARRLSSAVVPLALAVAMAAVQLFSMSTTEAAAADQVKTGVTADFVLSGGSAGLSPEVTDTVRQVAGVQSAMPVVRTQVLLEFKIFDEVEAESFAAQGIAPQHLRTTMDLAVKSGSMDELHGDTVALSTTAAGTVGADVGETVHVYLGDGTPKDLRVVAVYANGLGFGDVTAPHDLLARHTTTGFDDAILVSLTDGADVTALRELPKRYPSVAVVDRSTFAAAQQEQQALQSATNLIGNGLLLLYLVIAVVNTLVMATGARAREFAMLRLIGTSRRHVRRMMTLEAGVLVGAATVIGTAVAIVPLIGLSVATTGRALPSVNPLVYGMIVLATAVIGFSAIVLAARSAMRGRPVDAVGSGA
ncbi:ABC transporter permease [Kibdelosporangium aridum]|uniref:Putative ABC transport system permease protein n=1 Tax=Kibdelosporangium aridum TaxID=2030 RepID=A0A1W2FSN8_KIBAR|nr:ABC transporter permease [Kibdelosporangium aridum]SMD24977.1 putative ABC transport system permease protein [Kibdelosporangium aridum]